MFFLHNYGDVFDHRGYLISVLEDLFVFRLQHKVDGYNLPIMLMGKLHDGSGLSDLSGSFHNERFPIGTVFPFQEEGIYFSFQ